jgi:hypothetical protein
MGFPAPYEDNNMRRFDHRKYRPAPAFRLPERQWPSRVIEHAPIWASVDLRDGNQAPLEPMNVAQKRRIWSLLVKLGFEEIELAHIVQTESEQRGREIGSARIHEMLLDNFVVDRAPTRLLSYHLDCSGYDRIEVHIAEAGVERVLGGGGEGAIAAFVDCWRRHSGQRVNVMDYTEHSVGEGSDAQAASL